MRYLLDLKRAVRSHIPTPLLSLYHFSLALVGAALYGFPSRHMTVIAVTGTKGKSSTTEYINAAFESGGKRTALLNSIRMKVGGTSIDNPAGRSMPGRFFIQRFLRDARSAGCETAIIEMTSEGARQFRHRGISLDCLVFTNLAPEHIESHGSLQAYADAKFELGRHVLRSSKRPRIIIANADDRESARYLALPVEHTLPFSLDAHTPWHADERGGSLTFDGTLVTTSLPGMFSLQNALAAATTAVAFDIPISDAARGIAALSIIPGRAERIDAGQSFTVVVDYAHTPDSLQALLDAYHSVRKICILGSAGGGRDTWKRPVMGAIAEKECDVVILTNDDPYDEDPIAIIEAIAGGMKQRPQILPDRRDAIREAFAHAHPGDAVLITGKGRDAIYGPGGAKTPWDDAAVAREELAKLGHAAGIIKR